MFLHKLRKELASSPLLLPAAGLIRRERAKQFARFRQYCVHLSTAVPRPVFVKVGAHDGITGDPCSDILLAHANWRGLLIEPVPYCFARLSANFPDRSRFCFERVAIGSPAGEANFYYVDSQARQTDPGLPEWFDQVGSFDRNHVVKHLKGRLEPFIRECQVAVRPLSDVLATNHIEQVHLLHIDTEGHDFEVLQTLDFARHAPLSIFVEHRHLSPARKRGLVRLLRANGYEVRDCGKDYFAVNKKANSLFAQLESSSTPGRQ